MLLHLVSASPHRSSALANCLRRALPGASLLLIQDGVYAAVAASPEVADILAAELRCHALGDDARARGVEDKLDSRVELVDYRRFVELSVDCHAVQSWY